MIRTATIAAAIWILIGITPEFAGAQNSVATPQAAKEAALIDITGYWVSIVDEDWRWRMVTPAKGDYASIPLNAEGKKAADAWDMAKDERDGNQCRAYGAAGIMRLPTRLHIVWNDENTLRIDTDAGIQTRLLHFDGSKWAGGQSTWQGDSVSDWVKQTQGNGFGLRFGAAVPGKGGTLHVVTQHMRPGYYRKNGAPYSENAVMVEYIARVELDNWSYLIVTSVIRDPKYLKEEFITSEQFLREPNNSKWHPAPCSTEKPNR